MTDEPLNKGLLPAGFADMLPPEAATEAAVIEDLITAFVTRGYRRVKPPLLEFESSLLSGTGAAMDKQTFRLMDPVSQRMMGLRADMTPQVARLAGTRLAGAPRPLRLCYAGQVLRVRGSQIRPERQFAQVGAELIGSTAAAADAEVIVMAIDALGEIGVEGVCIDLGLPTLVPLLMGETGVSEPLRQALDRKDVVAVRALADDIGAAKADTLCRLIAAAGTAETAIAHAGALDLLAPAADAWQDLVDVVGLVRARAADTQLTIDPIEHRGFEYHTGVTFTLFAKGVRGELGSGGRYPSVGGDTGDEPATGFTLFTDSLLRAVPLSGGEKRVFLPASTDAGIAQELRQAGWITVAALDEDARPGDEARRLGCSHVLDGRKPKPVETGDE